MNNLVKITVATTITALSTTASAFWNPKDWDMNDGWGNNNGSDHMLAPFGWGSKDGRGPFGGKNGWGAIDSMADSMGVGDAMSDLNTDVEWDLNVDTKLKGRAQAEGKGSGENRSKARSRGRSRSDYRPNRPNRGNYYPPYYNSGQAAPYGYGPAPYGYGPSPYGPMGPSGQMPFAPAMPPPRQYRR